jgi:excisionase family DNA binding protein
MVLFRSGLPLPGLHHPSSVRGTGQLRERSPALRAQRPPLCTKRRRRSAEALEQEADAAEQARATCSTVITSPLCSDWIQDTVGQLPRLVTVAETAEALRMSVRNVHRLVARGRLIAVRAGAGGSSRVLVPRAQIARFLSALEAGQ